MDSGLLRAFVAAAEEQHFGRAAVRLVLTQQGLSQRIQRLEAQLAVELHRTTRRVELTDCGRQLLPLARCAVDAVDAVLEEGRCDQRPLRISSLDERLTPLLLLRQAMAADPELALEVSTNVELNDVLARLRSGAIDASFGWARATDSSWPTDIGRRLVAVDRLELLLLRDHPLALRGNPVPVAELRQVPLWFPAAGAPRGWTDYLHGWATAFGLPMDLSGSALGFDGFLAEVAGGRPSVYGSGMPAPGQDRLVRLPVTAPTPLVTWWLLWRRRITDRRIDQLLTAIDSILEATARPDGFDRRTVWVPQIDLAALEAELDRRRPPVFGSPG